MIAANYRKYPEALAAQLALDFGSLLKWATARPGSRILRAIRTARAAAMRAHLVVPPWFGPVCDPDSRKTPRWFKGAAKRARDLAATVRDACQVLWADVRLAVNATDTELLGFRYEFELVPVDAPWNQREMNPYRQRVMKRALKCETSGYPGNDMPCPNCRSDWQGRGISPHWHKGYWTAHCGTCHHDWRSLVPQGPQH